jgi:cytochrome d ubiquinol oxidase subunit II
VASLALLAVRRYLLVRVTAALAVAAVLWGWGAAQYPHLLAAAPGLTVAQAAAGRATLQATMISAGVGIVLLAPSLAWLFLLFQRGKPVSPPASSSTAGR